MLRCNCDGTRLGMELSKSSSWKLCTTAVLGEWITVLALMILLFHPLVQQYTLQGAVIKETGKQHLQHPTPT